MAEITLDSHNKVAIKLISLISLFLFFAIIAVILRIPARRHTRQKFNLSDYAIFLALFFLCALSATQYTACIIGGIGRPMSTVPGRKYITIAIRATKFGWLMWAASNTCVRISMLHLLYTLFWASNFTRRAVYILVAANLMYFTGVLIDFAAICRPFSFYWRSDIKGKCGNIQLGLLVIAIFNLILDFLLILLPMPVLWKLKMPTTRKIGVSIVFSMGAVICSITVLRIFSLRAFAKPSAKKHWTTSIFDDAFLTSVEPSLGIVNACIPLFPAVFRALATTTFWQRSVSFLSTVTGKSTSRSSSQQQSSQGGRTTTGRRTWPGSRNRQGSGSGSDGTATAHDEKYRAGSDGGSSVEGLRKQSGISSVAQVAATSDEMLDADLLGLDMRGMVVHIGSSSGGRSEASLEAGPGEVVLRDEFDDRHEKK